MTLNALLAIAVIVPTVITLALTYREAYRRSERRAEHSGGRQVERSGATSIIEDALLNPLIKSSPPDIKPSERPLTPASAARRILDFDPSLPLYIVVSRAKIDGANKYFALEDIRAVECFIRVRPSLLSQRSFSEVLVDPNRVPEGAANLILVGSPRSNPLTGQLLGASEIAHHLGCEFEVEEDVDTDKSARHNATPRYRIRMGDRVYRSQIYADEERFAHDPTGFVGRFSDYGLLAKFSRQDGVPGKVIVAAGIGALGTWGVGVFLQHNLLQLAGLVSEDDFSALVYSEREYGKGSQPEPEIERLHVVTDGTLTMVNVQDPQLN